LDVQYLNVKIVVCPDSFKESLSSIEAADAIASGLEIEAGVEPVEVVKIPLADGGEGTVEALVRAVGGEIRWTRVHDPLMRKIDSFFGILDGGKTAVIEAAAASGLHLLSESERNPLVTTTYGTGELISEASRAGVEKIIVGIGGSATNDAGAGAMTALGVRFLDASGNELPPGGAALAHLHRIDLSAFDFPLERIKIEVACDVTNPLTGPEGASAVFGPQKGATPEMVEHLDRALAHFAEVIRRDLGQDISELPGAGAAGGLGGGLAAFLRAKLRSGIDIVLDAVRFNEAIVDADLVITGEGRIDEQTAYGKTIGGVLRRTSRLGIPVIALVGSYSGNIRALYDAGLTAVFSIVPGPVSKKHAMEHAAELLKTTSANIARFAFAIGTKCAPLKKNTT
jgi:glycerate kinase